MRKNRTSKPTFSRRNLHGQVAHALGQRIVSGEVPEGEILESEDVASAGLGVSRTAYREAIKVLTSKGLLESRPKVGTRVRARGEWNMLDPDILLWASQEATTSAFADALFEFRQIIEPAAARMAAERATPEGISAIRRAMAEMIATDPRSAENVAADLAFHTAILQASGNELLSSLSFVVEALLVRSFEISARLPDAREVSLPLHQAVSDFIANGEAAAAQSTMTELLLGARRDIDQVLDMKGANQRPAIHKRQGSGWQA